MELPPLGFYQRLSLSLTRIGEGAQPEAPLVLPAGVGLSLPLAARLNRWGMPDSDP